MGKKAEKNDLVPDTSVLELFSPFNSYITPVEPPVDPETMVEPDEGEPSPVREALNTSTAWSLLSNDPVVRPQIRYTSCGVEEVDRTMHPQLRARLYLIATAVLNAKGIPHEAQRDVPFYVRGLLD